MIYSRTSLHTYSRSTRCSLLVPPSGFTLALTHQTVWIKPLVGIKREKIHTINKLMIKYLQRLQANCNSQCSRYKQVSQEEHDLWACMEIIRGGCYDKGYFVTVIWWILILWLVKDASCDRDLWCGRARAPHVRHPQTTNRQWFGYFCFWLWFRIFLS